MTSPLRLFVSKANLLNVNKRTGPTFDIKAAGLTNSQQGKKKNSSAPSLFGSLRAATLAYINAVKLFSARRGTGCYS